MAQPYGQPAESNLKALLAAQRGYAAGPKRASLQGASVASAVSVVVDHADGDDGSDDDAHDRALTEQHRGAGVAQRIVRAHDERHVEQRSRQPALPGEREARVRKRELLQAQAESRFVPMTLAERPKREPT